MVDLTGIEPVTS